MVAEAHADARVGGDADTVDANLSRLDLSERSAQSGAPTRAPTPPTQRVPTSTRRGSARRANSRFCSSSASSTLPPPSRAPSAPRSPSRAGC
eukprot:3273973-Prymnesium_polylepis.1